MQVPIEENQSEETEQILKSVIQKKFLKLKKKKKDLKLFSEKIHCTVYPKILTQNNDS